MRLLISVCIVASNIFFAPHLISGVESHNASQVSASPITIDLSQYDLPKGNVKLEMYSVTPDGKQHQITDLSGHGQWSVETMSLSKSFTVNPSKHIYAGPIQVKLNGQVAIPPIKPTTSSKQIYAEKVLTSTLADGIKMQVHYTDYVIEKAGSRSYPLRVLQHMENAYSILKKELKLDEQQSIDLPKKFDLYLGDDDPEGLTPFGGFSANDYKRAPLFILKDNHDGTKTPVILLPANYRKFLRFWNKINNVPYGMSETEDDYLASSIMHEMTHAVTHSFNENLGSTEYEIRNGDWYTEGLARYFETKIGTHSGFASQGFRKQIDDHVQFSRGGANYYLKHHDEPFFNLRYENALFWLYFDHTYGMDKIIELSSQLSHLPYDSDYRRYSEVLQKVSGISVDDLLHDYFKWIYRESYRLHKEGEGLLAPAKTMTVWSDGMFYIYSKYGELLDRVKVLKTDWVAFWGSSKAKRINEVVAGDWSHKADIQPYTFDIHEILTSKDWSEPVTIQLRNTGASQNLKATFYLEINGRVTPVDYSLKGKGHIEISTDIYEKLTKVGIVLTNLDPSGAAEYEIEIV